MSRPSVSVVVPAYRSQDTIAWCLAGIAAQGSRGVEVIVVDSSPDAATSEVVARTAPGAVLVRSPVRLLPHAARNEGVRRARGRVLVFTDPDCRPSPDWLERLVGALDERHPVVGGAIASAERDWVTRGVHLCKFGSLVPGARPGTRPWLATANQAWRREVWEAHGPYSPHRWAGDTELEWRVRRAGYELGFEPRAVVVHTHATTLGSFWRERRLRGDDFARMRAASGAWSPSRRAMYLAAMPLEPLIMLGRSLRDAARAQRLLEGLSTLPVLLAGHLAWASGEAAALARGLAPPRRPAPAR